MLLSCARPKADSKLYAIDSVVTSQINALAVAGPALQKEIVLGSKKDQVTYRGDSADWVKELEIFRELDVLNKPVSRASYVVDDNLYDPGSNLTVKAFTAEDDALPVSSLRVFYQSNVNNPRRIEAVMHETTALYQSRRLMTLEFNQVHNKTVLTSYSIVGGQKMILGDSVPFSVKGTIRY